MNVTFRLPSLFSIQYVAASFTLAVTFEESTIVKKLFFVPNVASVKASLSFVAVIAVKSNEYVSVCEVATIKLAYRFNVPASRTESKLYLV